MGRTNAPICYPHSRYIGVDGLSSFLFGEKGLALLGEGPIYLVLRTSGDVFAFI